MARTFQFRLETVRRLRGQELDARRRDVAEAAREVQAVQRRIADLAESARANLTHTLASQSGMDIPVIRMHYVHHGYLARQAVNAELRLGECRSELAARRRKLHESHAKARAIDKLYERQKSRFDQEQQKEERKSEDELAAQVYNRKLRDIAGIP